MHIHFLSYTIFLDKDTTRKTRSLRGEQAEDRGHLEAGEEVAEDDDMSQGW